MRLPSPSPWHMLHKRDSERTFIRFEETNLTYRQVIRRILSLAQQLRELKVVPGQRVASYCLDGPDYIYSMFATWLLGADYYPVDGLCDRTTLRFLQVKYIICSNGALAAEAGQIDGCTAIDLSKPEGAPIADAELDRLLDVYMSRAGYIFCSSGSTSKPKIIRNSLEGVASRILSACEIVGISEQDVILAFLKRTFDASLFDVFCAIYSGSALCLVTEEVREWAENRLPGYLNQHYSETYPTVAVLIPALLQGLKQKDMPRLKKVLTTGSECSKQHLLDNGWFDGVVVYNGYGPTEATICATIDPVSKDDEKFPMELALRGVEFLISVNGVELISLAGAKATTKETDELELVLAGEGIGCYLQADDKSRQRFKSGYYYTGDLLQLVGGKLCYFARKDRQIKRHGVLVDLDDIEDHLQKANIGLVERISVVLIGRSGGKQIVAAFVEPTPGFNDAQYFHNIAQKIKDGRRYCPDISYTVGPCSGSGGGKNSRNLEGLCKRSPTLISNPVRLIDHCALNTVILRLVQSVWVGIAFPPEIPGVDDIVKQVPIYQSLNEIGGSSITIPRFVTLLKNWFRDLITGKFLFDDFDRSIRSEFELLRDDFNRSITEARLGMKSTSEIELLRDDFDRSITEACRGMKSISEIALLIQGYVNYNAYKLVPEDKLEEDTDKMIVAPYDIDAGQWLGIKLRTGGGLIGGSKCIVRSLPRLIKAKEQGPESVKLFLGIDAESSSGEIHVILTDVEKMKCIGSTNVVKWKVIKDLVVEIFPYYLVPGVIWFGKSPRWGGFDNLVITRVDPSPEPGPELRTISLEALQTLVQRFGHTFKSEMVTLGDVKECLEQLKLHSAEEILEALSNPVHWKCHTWEADRLAKLSILLNQPVFNLIRPFLIASSPDQVFDPNLLDLKVGLSVLDKNLLSEADLSRHLNRAPLVPSEVFACDGGDRRYIHCVRKSQDDSLPPLFLFHSLTGDIPTEYLYQEDSPSSLPAHLSKEFLEFQSVYAFQSDGKFSSFAEMVETYLRIVKKIRQQGPYIFIGWSFGVFIANAVSVKIAEQHEVYIVNIDFPPPSYLHGLDYVASGMQILKHVVGLFLESVDFEGALITVELSGEDLQAFECSEDLTPVRDRFLKIAKFYYDDMFSRAEPEKAERFRDMVHTAFRHLRLFRESKGAESPKLAAKTLVLEARDKGSNLNQCVYAEAWPPYYAEGAVTFQEIPDNHFGLFREELFIAINSFLKLPLRQELLNQGRRELEKSVKKQVDSAMALDREFPIAFVGDGDSAECLNGVAEKICLRISEEPGLRVFCLTGPGGVGKSTTLMCIVKKFVEHSDLVVPLDLESEGEDILAASIEKFRIVGDLASSSVKRIIFYADDFDFEKLEAAKQRIDFSKFPAAKFIFAWRTEAYQRHTPQCLERLPEFERYEIKEICCLSRATVEGQMSAVKELKFGAPVADYFTETLTYPIYLEAFCKLAQGDPGVVKRGFSRLVLLGALSGYTINQQMCKIKQGFGLEAECRLSRVLSDEEVKLRAIVFSQWYAFSIVSASAGERVLDDSLTAVLKMICPFSMTQRGHSLVLGYYSAGYIFKILTKKDELEINKGKLRRDLKTKGVESEIKRVEGEIKKVESEIKWVEREIERIFSVSSFLDSVWQDTIAMLSEMISALEAGKRQKLIGDLLGFVKLARERCKPGFFGRNTYSLITRTFSQKLLGPIMQVAYRYRDDLRRQASDGDTWYRLPDSLIEKLKPYFPLLDLASINIAKNINTGHGLSIELDKELFFPAGFFDEGKPSLRVIIRALCHAQSYEQYGGFESFILHYCVDCIMTVMNYLNDIKKTRRETRNLIVAINKHMFLEKKAEEQSWHIAGKLERDYHGIEKKRVVFEGDSPGIGDLDIEEEYLVFKKGHGDIAAERTIPGEHHPDGAHGVDEIYRVTDEMLETIENCDKLSCALDVADSLGEVGALAEPMGLGTQQLATLSQKLPSFVPFFREIHESERHADIGIFSEMYDEFNKMMTGISVAYDVTQAARDHAISQVPRLVTKLKAGLFRIPHHEGDGSSAGATLAL